MTDDRQNAESLNSIWKRQMRFYGVAMGLGLLVLVWAIMHIRSSGADLHEHPWLMVESVAGGLALLGGLFGFGLAVFFSMWHKK